MQRSHARQWRELDQLYRAAKDTLHKHGNHEPVPAYFLKQCDALRDTQARQREELRTAWETRNAERSAALSPFTDRDATRRAGRAYGQGLTRSRTGDERFGGRGGPEPG